MQYNAPPSMMLNVYAGDADVMPFLVVSQDDQIIFMTS